MRFPSYFPRLFRPPVYQGRRHAKNYFEGWYYKHVDATGKHIWSVIFGVSHSADPHSFIQVIEGTGGETDYIRFDIADFSYDTDQLRVTIGKNIITGQYMQLDLSSDKFSIRGRVEYSETTPFPQKLTAPGIMGWYTYAPFMECYHGVVSMNHGISGRLEINSANIDFTGGKGYIEKDWGRSMPSDWVWLQCNHFDDAPGASLMVSVARIPWLTGHFPGFLSFFRLNGTVYRFATYNRSVIEHIGVDQDAVKMRLRNRRHILELEVERNISGELKAPVKGEMERKIAESLDAGMLITLKAKSGKVLYHGQGAHAGLEIVGDVEQYIRLLK